MSILDLFKRDKVQFRIESGPARITAIATKKLLDNLVTAPHYQVGRFDAWGQKIELGKEMTYLDYYGQNVWYVYRYEQVGVDRDGAVIMPGDISGREAITHEWRWVPFACETTYEAAAAKVKTAGGKV